MATIRIPSPLRQYADHQAVVTVENGTVNAALAELTTRYPTLHNHLYNGDTLRSFVNIYLNQEDIRHLDGDQMQLSDGDQLLIVPSIAGG